MEIKIIKWPTPEDWVECKRRALVTMYGKGLGEVQPPSSDWKYKILRARHSPIRYLMYSFLITDIPSNTSVHFCRHVHAQPYVSSLRNDRQNVMDGDAARRDTPVNMILDVNAEELMVMANKRLCGLASERTREVMQMIRDKVVEVTPEMNELLVPMCMHWGRCNEFRSCHMWD